MNTQASDSKAELTLFMVTIIGAIGWIVSKTALSEMPALLFMAYRFTLAALILMFIAPRELFSINASQFWRSACSGLLFGLAMLVWVEAIRVSSNIGVGSFIISLNIVIVPILARILFGYHIEKMLLIALLPAIAGLYFLSAGQGEFTLAYDHALFLISMVLIAGQLVVMSHYVHDVPAYALSIVQLFTGAATAWIGTLFFEQSSLVVSTKAWMIILFSAVFATSIRFVLQANAMKKVSASRTAMIFLAEPIWTTLLAMLFLSERMSAQQIAGCALVFFAIALYRIPVFKKIFDKS
jgi:drug/metabolite transporter (DMT)-like permease